MSLANRTRRWRIAALCGLLLLVAAVTSPSVTRTAEAHVGPPGTFCGSTNTITAYYVSQYSVGVHHYHTFEYIGGGLFDNYCGPIG